MSNTHVYKLLTLTDWANAQVDGVTATTLDTADGYVHLSTRDTVAETARLHYAGQENVRLLEFGVADLSALKWEPSRGAILFPHLYDALDIRLATRSWTLMQDANGVPALPEDF